MICSICQSECSGPGKFEGSECQTVARVLYNIIGDGGGADECGDVETTGWYGLILGPAAPDTSAAYIVSEDGNGFFGYTGYLSEELARKEWDELEGEIVQDMESAE